MDLSNEDEDPRGWSIDQVVQELCHNPTPSWSSGDRPQLIPDRHVLENTFRENHLDGDNLLALDMAALKDDLGLSSFGQRRAVMRAIEYFRLHSRSYQQMAFQADSIARMQSYTTPQITQSRASLVAQSPNVGLGILPTIDARQQTHSPSFNSAVVPGMTQTIPPQHPSPIRSVRPAPHPTVAVTAPSDRAMMLQDGVNSVNGVHTLGEPSSGKPQQTGHANAVVKPKKKIAPTLVSQLQDTAPAESIDGSYLSQSAVPVQEVFYFRLTTDFDDVIYRPPIDESSNFVSGGLFPSGQRRNVGRLMKKFLIQGTYTLHQSGLKVTVPYDDRVAKKPYSERYFTLFPRDGARARVFRTEDYPETRGVQSKSFNLSTPYKTKRTRTSVPVKESMQAGQNSGTMELDYLLDRYPVEESDDGLPIYGDSGDEGDYDEDTWREIEEEEAERNQTLKHMSPAEIDSTIINTIQEMRQEWRETRLAKVQLKAYRMWMRAALKKDRQQVLKHIEFEKARYQKMIEKIKRAVADDIWHNETELRKQCQSIETAVFSHEEFTYYQEVMLQDTPPERPTQRALKASRPHGQQVLEEGEELIESDSEPMSDEEEENNFVVDDSSDVGSIHYEPDLDEWNPVLAVVTKAVDTQLSTTHASPTPVPTPPSEVVETPLDTYADDADAESSEHEIITPARRKRVSPRPSSRPVKSATPAKPKTPAKTPALKQELITPGHTAAPKADDSSDISDFDRSRRLPQSKYKKQGRTKVQPVDLTVSSPAQSSIEDSTDFSVHTPELNPTARKAPHPVPKRRKQSTASQSSSIQTIPQLSSEDDSGLPHFEDVEGMRRIDWSVIEELADSPVPEKRRALAKALFELDIATVNDLSLLVQTRRTSDNRKDLLLNGLSALTADDCLIENVKAKQQSSAHLLVRLYAAFVCGQNMVDDANMTDKHRDEAYAQMGDALEFFFELLINLIAVLVKHESQAPNQGTKKRKRQDVTSDEEIFDDTDLPMTDDTSASLVELDEPPSAHKKRKRKVEESQQARSLQISDQLRMQLQEDRRKAMAQKFAHMNAASGETVVEPINTMEPYVYLHPHIAQRAKPHQVHGIQFMWREIVEDPKQQGCILAHTMGLGKTMQVISLLVTISLCSQSQDVDKRKHVPSRLRKTKTLILCPASLVENWFDELLMWTPKPDILGPIRRLEKSKELLDELQEWKREGGVLLVSYDKFRTWIKASADGKLSAQIEEILLEEPNLVVADEAHKLKNAHSKINAVAKRFKTTSRIALTGSPLNNHLEEYHTMVDWIAPGYLGDMVQFRSKYSEPINEGLYAESTALERRISLRKLHVLKRDLAPKIDRADISAIAKDMPPKTEFIITVPLTDLQKQAYNVYLQRVLQSMHGVNVRSQNARIWYHLNILSWLCHHPSCVILKLKQRAKEERENAEQKGADQSTSGDEGADKTIVRKFDHHPATPDEIAEDVEIETTGPMAEALQRISQIFEAADDANLMDDPALSYRTLAVQQIVKQAMAVGDKTLIFTQSIPTLDYLERMLKSLNCLYCRLSGETKMASRQAATKAFNQDGQQQVFLISTRAGGLGLNLQGANRVIIFDFGFNPSWEEQAIGRAYRLNQTRPVFVYRFQSGGTFEDKLFNQAIFKTQLFGRVVDQKKPTRHASKQMKEYLFLAKDVAPKDFQRCLGKDPKVLDAIIDKMDFVRNIDLTETFHKEDDEQLNDEDQKAAEEEYRDQCLLRDDPAAWRAKHVAEEAEQRKQQQANFHAAYSTNLPSSTAPLPSFRGNGAARSSYAYAGLPFSREDLNAPPDALRPAQVPPAAAGVRSSYDTTYQDFVQQPHTKRRARSIEGDVNMKDA
ncbi:RAD54-like protein 2 [Exophiala viscosa]|uniref:RAD54-like protein 2 n=1 Tax=Exophiala viscosa TaxID=2486360 RepID=UPI00218D1554|nr:RAD54-like protein 2 [Exophiala viscosa]